LDTQKGVWLASQGHIPYLKAQNAKGNHILIQPDHQVEPFYLIADDLNHNLIKKHHKRPGGEWKPGRMVIETSPGNFQVWIHSDRHLSLEEKRFWLKKLHSDPAADPHHRWGRCPGFFNRKEKYRSSSGRFPLAKLIWVDWLSVVHIPRAQRKPPKAISQNRILPTNNHNHLIMSRLNYNRDNESATDFAYALALARRNFSKLQIIERISQERIQWNNHQGDSRKNQYLERTVSKAINIIMNDPK